LTTSPIALKIKAQNGYLAKCLKESGCSQKELADSLGINYHQFNSYVCMRSFPRTKEIMDKLTSFTGKSAEELFPSFLKNPDFLAVNKTCIVFKDIDIKYLQSNKIEEIAYEEDQEESDKSIIDKETSNIIYNNMISILTPTEQEIIKKTIIDGKTLDETGKNLKLTREGVRLIKNRSLRKLRLQFKQKDDIL
jgi:RNA polymerase sigma factor (sigma-70 family)